MITASCLLDLRRDDESTDRKNAGVVYDLPDGAHVIVLIGSRPFPPFFVIDWFSQHACRLHFELQGSAQALGPWMRELRRAAPEIWGRS